jgi:hypothetical protein
VPVPGTGYVQIVNRWVAGAAITATGGLVQLAVVDPGDPAGHWFALP